MVCGSSVSEACLQSKPHRNNQELLLKRTLAGDNRRESLATLVLS